MHEQSGCSLHNAVCLVLMTAAANIQKLRFEIQQSALNATGAKEENNNCAHCLHVLCWVKTSSDVFTSEKWGPNICPIFASYVSGEFIPNARSRSVTWLIFP